MDYHQHQVNKATRESWHAQTVTNVMLIIFREVLGSMNYYSFCNDRIGFLGKYYIASRSKTMYVLELRLFVLFWAVLTLERWECKYNKLIIFHVFFSSEVKQVPE